MVVHAQSFHPIPLGQREEFKRKLAEYRPKREWPIPPVPLIRSIYFFGFHPEVYAHPVGSGLQVFNGKVMAKRPKTDRWVGENRGGNVLPDSMAPEFSELLKSLHEPLPGTCRIRRVAYWVDGEDDQGARVRDSVQRWRDQDFCYETVSYEVRMVTTDMGFSHVGPRTLRHTAGNEVWRRTHSLRAVMDWLAVNRADAELYCVENEQDSGANAAMAGVSV